MAIMSKILINDATLRDGSHAVAHRLTAVQIAAYAAAAEVAPGDRRFGRQEMPGPAGSGVRSTRRRPAGEERRRHGP